MTSNSSTGGYLNSPVTPAFPNGLTFIQFLQTVLVGISGFDGHLVRPAWQKNPPKRPDQDINWLAFGIEESEAKGFPYQNFDKTQPTPAFQTQFNSKVTLKLDLYGPAAFENYGLIRDAFYMPQNNESLVAAGFGLVGVNKAIHVPDLIDEIWFDRYVFSVELYYLQCRSYPILSFVSANGILKIPLSHDPHFELSWLVKEGP